MNSLGCARNKGKVFLFKLGAFILELALGRLGWP